MQVLGQSAHVSNYMLTMNTNLGNSERLVLPARLKLTTTPRRKSMAQVQTSACNLKTKSEGTTVMIERSLVQKPSPLVVR